MELTQRITQTNMTMNPLPPQAYTKETLLKAYGWLQTQTTGIKEMASHPDILVSLYLKATSEGDEALQRPSIVNFKKELKSLAGMMDEFEVVETSVVSSSHSISQQMISTNQQSPQQLSFQGVASFAAPAHSKNNLLSQKTLAPKNHNQTPVPSLNSSSISVSQNQGMAPNNNQNLISNCSQNSIEVPYSNENLNLEKNEKVLDLIDPRSCSMIREVKSEFNLSSDMDALRMLIIVGYKRLKATL